MDMGKVSVIIPAYNAAAFVETAIGAALNQIAVDVEVIVIDDGSTDGTAEKLLDLASTEPRIRILTHSVARGPAAARNYGLREARGEWIAVLDADDNWKPGRLMTLLTEMRRRNLDVVADNQSLIRFETGEGLGRAFPDIWMTDELLTVENLISRDWPGRQNCRPLGNLKIVAKRAFLNSTHVFYDESLHVGEDFVFYATLLLNSAAFGLVNDELYIYSYRRGSISSSNIQSMQQLLSANCQLEKLCEQTLILDVDRVDRLKTMLRKRAQALQYQILAQSLKLGDVQTSYSALREMNVSYAAFRLARAALIRLGVCSDDAVRS